jgi:hypothetical protein
MVQLMIERIADDRADGVDEESAAEHLAGDCGDLCLRSMEMFRNRTLGKEIIAFSKSLGLSIKMEKIDPGERVQ